MKRGKRAQLSDGNTAITTHTDWHRTGICNQANRPLDRYLGIFKHAWDQLNITAIYDSEPRKGSKSASGGRCRRIKREASRMARGPSREPTRLGCVALS